MSELSSSRNSNSRLSDQQRFSSRRNDPISDDYAYASKDYDSENYGVFGNPGYKNVTFVDDEIVEEPKRTASIVERMEQGEDNTPIESEYAHRYPLWT